MKNLLMSDRRAQISVERDLRFTHHRGLARILEFCGPEYFQSPSMLPVFESIRLTLVRFLTLSHPAILWLNHRC